MKQHTELRVNQAAGELAPRTFTWRERTLRVLYVVRVRTRGAERFYRVQTTGGIYELGLNTASNAWRMRHSPTRISQMMAALRRLPRYPLPQRRQRSLGSGGPHMQPAVIRVEGGSRVDWLTMVR